jgi:glycosyltransferase involved in cell wall biosynthesis
VTRRFDGTPVREQRPGLTVRRIGRPLPGGFASVQYSVLGALAVARARPDVIHAHDLLSPSTAALLASRRGRIPVIVKVLSAGPGGDIDRLLQKPLGRRRLDAAARRFKAFIAISDEVRDELMAHGVSADRIRHIPNGVDTEAFRPPTAEERRSARERLGLPDDALVGIYCGRFFDTKHVEVLAQAARHAPLHVLLFGEGPRGDALRELAADPALDGRVRVFPPVDDTAPLYQAADLYLSASEAEGMSNSVLEAMASGLPTLAAEAPGMRELLGDGAGVMVPDRTPEAFASAAASLSREDLARIGATAREHVVGRYSIEAVADQLRDLYAELAPHAATAGRLG